MSNLNRANLDLLIAALEGAKDEQFDMRWVYSDAAGHAIWSDEFRGCGTAACIGGWANHVSGSLSEGLGHAAYWLALSDDQECELFAPAGYDDDDKNFTRLRAIDVLKHLRDTGEVDWDRFPAENYTVGASHASS